METILVNMVIIKSFKSTPPTPPALDGSTACAQGATRCYKPDELLDSAMLPINVFVCLFFFLIIKVYLQLEICISKSELRFESTATPIPGV